MYLTLAPFLVRDLLGLGARAGRVGTTNTQQAKMIRNAPVQAIPMPSNAAPIMDLVKLIAVLLAAAARVAMATAPDGGGYTVGGAAGVGGG